MPDPTPIEDHVRDGRCTAWCADGVHVDLVYFDADQVPVSTVAAVYAGRGCRLLVVDIALEARPDPSGLGRAAHLVWWTVDDA